MTGERGSNFEGDEDRLREDVGWLNETRRFALQAAECRAFSL